MERARRKRGCRHSGSVKRSCRKVKTNSKGKKKQNCYRECLKNCISRYVAAIAPQTLKMARRSLDFLWQLANVSYIVK